MMHDMVKTTLLTAFEKRQATDKPVFENQQGERFVCHAVFISSFMSGWTWYVFGILNESHDDPLLYGYIRKPEGSGMGNFSYENIRHISEYPLLDKKKILLHGPPAGWRVVQDNDDIESITNTSKEIGYDK